MDVIMHFTMSCVTIQFVNKQVLNDDSYTELIHPHIRIHNSSDIKILFNELNYLNFI